MRRLFAAIHITAETGLLSLLGDAERIFIREKIRWVKHEQMHLTLKFFGDTPESAIAPIMERFSGVIEGYQGFSCLLKGTGVFGSRYKPRVIWAGTANDNALRVLGENLLDAAAEAGFPRDRLPFVPHLTLGRITHIGDKKRFSLWVDEHKGDILQEVHVKTVTLFESTLKPSGAEYSVVKTFVLPS